jgi:DNA polymerase-1
MRIVLDIEANGLKNPDKVWLIVAKDIDTGEVHVFRGLTQNAFERARWEAFYAQCTLVVGHNLLDYDVPVLVQRGLIPDPVHSLDKFLDTLIISRLVDYSRKGGHSVECYGEEFSSDKGTFHKWNDPELNNVNSILFSQLETYCIRDVEITYKIYKKYLKYISDTSRSFSISLEHQFQYLIVNSLEDNGFSFNKTKAEDMLSSVTSLLNALDKDMHEAFPKKLKLVREVTPRATKHGTIARNSIPRILGDDLSVYTEGAAFCLCEWSEFNPSSHKQLISVLNESGWVPEEKTQTHIDTEREVSRLKYTKQRDNRLDTTLSESILKLEKLKLSGWKISEKNLDTLPDSAPAPTRLLAKRILLESRRRTLTEWLSLVQDDGRIHGDFYGIGAWTHRMAHQKPNTANIPNEFDTEGKRKLLGKEMRSLWMAPRNRLLVGVDAEGIQLRIFAHYIDDAEFTKALVEGDKNAKTDPHSLNQRILGSVCKSRAAAKRFIYALLLGAGLDKLAQILSCSKQEAEEALGNLIDRYSGFAKLKSDVIPADAKRGWFEGLDGRAVKIPGETVGARKHLAMSGYLQNGEAVCMKYASLIWHAELTNSEILKELKCKYKLVDMVHDEWQTECNNNMEIAIEIAKIQAKSLETVGKKLNLKCPLAGSYWNDDHHDYTIGTNWSVTH